MSESDHVVRRVREDDLPELVRLCRAHAEYERESYSENGKAERLRQMVLGDSAHIHCLVVEVGGNLVGYASFMKQYSTWNAEPYIYMDCLYLDPPARGQGIGGQLREAIRAKAAQMGCRRMQWQTPEFNHDAIRFYNRLDADAFGKQRFVWQFD